MQCRFENRRQGLARVLRQPVESIQAFAPEQLGPAFERIRHAQEQGYWVALLLDYELGYWLEPSLACAAKDRVKHQHAPLTALVFKEMVTEAPWPAPLRKEPLNLQPKPRITREQYIRTVGSLRQRIAAGDFYQVNYTFPIDIVSPLPAAQLYCLLANQHPSAHAAFIQTEHRCIASFSPELFITRQGRDLTVRPMKGTAPRHADPAADALSARTLETSEKDRAENLMIVDLLRNDLGRIADPGSVHVRELFTLEAYRSVWTLTSTITAQSTATDLETLLRALFPCGSVTGAPKIAAMQAIHQVEPYPRGIYCGSLGWLAPDGDLELNVAIRTLELFDDGRGVYSAGGGIVHDSQPETEWQECLWKARIIGADTEAKHD